jgi:hypothetical protein
LRDGAFLLRLVELELLVLFLDLVVDAVEGIVDVVLANLLLLGWVLACVARRRG